MSSSSPTDHNRRRSDVVEAALSGDLATVVAHASDPEPAVRASALRGLTRLGALDDEWAARWLVDEAAEVRRALAEAAARADTVDLGALLADPDPTVVETAAWAVGERRDPPDDELEALMALAGQHPEPLVREAAVAALGACADARALPVIVAATGDKATVRRRAVLALAPFAGPDVDAALTRALTDRDWQVRQAAEDLLAGAPLSRPTANPPS